MQTVPTPAASIRDFPVEVLTHIFHLSTYIPSCYQSRSSRHRPFRSSKLRSGNTLPAEKAAWITRFSLSLTCTFWRELALDFLYEEIYVGKHLESLLKALVRLETTDSHNCVGRKVRRVVFCRLSIGLPHSILSDILSRCPYVEYLVKEGADLVPLTPVKQVDVSAIKRFDWVGIGPPHTPRECINCDLYRKVVSQATNLRHLHIAMCYPTPGPISHDPVIASSLIMLSLRSIGPSVRHDLESWHFPKLTHIITDSCLTSNTLSPFFGPHIQTIEFRQDEYLYDASLRVLDQCPNLRELSYYIEFGLFVLAVDYHNKLECVRLHSGRNYTVDVLNGWRHVELQFSVLAGKGFPSLRRVVLYGDWEKFFAEPKFVVLCDGLHDRKCSVEDEYGRTLLTKA